MGRSYWGVACGDASADLRIYEPSLRLNKTRPKAVKISHDGEHPFNKANDKHERKQIKQNVGGRSNQRGGFDHGGGARNDHRNKIHRPADWHDDNGIGYDNERRNNRGRAGLRLHQFPHLHDDGAGEILLHQEHHRCGPDGQNGRMVGHSSGYARDRLLREGRRPYDRSQGRPDEAGQRGDREKRNYHHDNNKALTVPNLEDLRPLVYPAGVFFCCSRVADAGRVSDAGYRI